MKRIWRGHFEGAPGRFNPSLGKHQSVCMENCSVSNNIPLLGPSEMGTSGCDWEMETDRAQTDKSRSWCSKWTPNKAGKLCPEAPGPGCLCGKSHLLTDSPIISVFCGLSFCWGFWEPGISLRLWVSLCFPSSSSPSLSAQPLLHGELQIISPCFVSSQIFQEFNYLDLTSPVKPDEIQSWQVLGVANREINPKKQPVPVCLLQTLLGMKLLPPSGYAKNPPESPHEDGFCPKRPGAQL